MRRAKREGALQMSIAAGASIAVLAYAALRVVERSFFPEPNPAMLIWSDQSPFTWRAAIALYIGGAGVFAGHALASRAPRAAGRWLLFVITAAVAAITAQGALWP